MSGRSAQSNNRGSNLFGYFVSGKYKEFHTNQFAASLTTRGLTATGGVITASSVNATSFTGSGSQLTGLEQRSWLFG